MKLTKTGLPQGYTKYDAFVWYNPGKTKHAGIYIKKSLASHLDGFIKLPCRVRNYAHVPFIHDTSAESTINYRLGPDYKTINFIKKEREEAENETAT